MIAAMSAMSAVVAMQFFGLEQILRRPFPLIVVIMVSLTALVTAGMAISPNRYWNRWEDFFDSRRHQLEQTRLPPSHRVAWLVILASWFCFILIVTRLWELPTDPTSNDPAAFLRYAQDVKNEGGVMVLVTQLFQGTYSQANQHPLFTALLSFGPTFPQGQILSLAIGSITLVMVTLWTARKWNLTVAALVSVILSTNFAFCSTSSMVTCEGLITLFISLTWLLLAPPPKSTEEAETSQRTATFHAPVTSLAVGGLLGLAFLTKGTGPLFLIITLAWLWGCHTYHRRQQNKIAGPIATAERFPWKSTTLILLAWLIVAAPLVSRNVRRFDNPIYNANSYFLFLDHFEDLEVLADEQSIGRTAQEYFASHNLGQMLQREVHGVCWESYLFVRSLGPAPLDDSRILFGLPCLLLALAGVFAERSQAGLLLGCWLVCFIVLFAWYMPIAAGQRFTVPLLPAFCVCAATGLARLAHSRPRLASLGPLTWLTAALLWCLLWTGSTYFLIP